MCASVSHKIRAGHIDRRIEAAMSRIGECIQIDGVTCAFKLGERRVFHSNATAFGDACRWTRLAATDSRRSISYHGPRGGRLKPDTVRRILVREVIAPLIDKFPTPEGVRGFQVGRLHSFRHYFCSTCANSGVPERIVMDWLGHADSEMIRHYYHLHDEEAKRRMDSLNFLGGASGWSAGQTELNDVKEEVEPPIAETSGNGKVDDCHSFATVLPQFCHSSTVSMKNAAASH